MAKRKRSLNVNKFLMEGRGTGTGPQYIPWLKIQDVPSLGRATRLHGIKTGRQHEFLSDMERDFFYLLEFSDEVVDIREQFPLLPLEDTILIAKELGIEHPKHPTTGENIVITTDFLITVNYENGFRDIARTIKSKDDLMDRRVLEKFEIERVYWRNKEIDWGVVTECEINKTVAHNISYVHNYADIAMIDSFIQISNIELNDLIGEFIKRIKLNDKPIRIMCNHFDKDMSLENGSGLSIFKYLIINKMIATNIREKIDVFKFIPITIKGKSISEVDVG